jgi:hypothetical protein
MARSSIARRSRSINSSAQRLQPVHISQLAEKDEREREKQRNTRLDEHRIISRDNVGRSFSQPRMIKYPLSLPRAVRH